MFKVNMKVNKTLLSPTYRRYKVMRDCWHSDPGMRPSFSGIWFDSCLVMVFCSEAKPVRF
jgi:hypothetical protein